MNSIEKINLKNYFQKKIWLLAEKKLNAVTQSTVITFKNTSHLAQL
jgi:hypothetical protein